MVVALHDVTYFRELDQLKDRFVSNVSHELRNPLSSIMLQISTLLRYYERFAEADRHRMLIEIQQQAYILRELIEEILELSRLDAGRSLPQKEWFDLTEQVRQVSGTLELSAHEKNQTLELSGLDSAYYVQADPHQITRVLRNLISNAIKYTPENGRITLCMAADGDRVRLSVTDTGIGISPDDQVNIFDRFYRTVEASEMASGTGLGLSITKEIIELHGGRIEVQSVLGEGSTFIVTLPVSSAPLDG
jgi:signal transduction histidine kinase